MNWQDEGFLISKRKFRENANIIDVFTNLHGKVSGIVYGGNSRKIRNYLQISNKIYIIYKSKSENKLGYFQTELIEAISPKYFNDKKRTSVLLSATSLLKNLLPDHQPNNKIYNYLSHLTNNLDNESWPIIYIFWELNLIKELGFNPNLNMFKDKNDQGIDFINCEIDNVKYNVPIFLIKNETPKNITNSMIRKSLIFTRSILQNKFFIPSNLIFPKSRIIFENYFN